MNSSSIRQKLLLLDMDHSFQCFTCLLFSVVYCEISFISSIVIIIHSLYADVFAESPLGICCDRHDDGSPALITLNIERHKRKETRSDSRGHCSGFLSLYNCSVWLVNESTMFSLQKGRADDEEGGLYFYVLHASLSVFLRTRNTMFIARRIFRVDT